MTTGDFVRTVCVVLFVLPAAADQVRETPLLGHFLYRAQVVPDEGVTVRRLDVDVTGDGAPELLLAKSQRMPLWFIYEKTTTKTYRFIGNVSFIGEYFRVDRDPPRIVVSLPNEEGAWRTVVLRYRPGNPPFEECLPRGSADCKDTGESFDDWRKRSRVRQMYARLAELESSDDPQWVDRESMETVPGVGGLRGLLVRDGG